MEYRQLGRTGVKVSELCLGCMMFGGRTDEADSIEIVDRALDAGINFVDTDNVYHSRRERLYSGADSARLVQGQTRRHESHRRTAHDRATRGQSGGS